MSRRAQRVGALALLAITSAVCLASIPGVVDTWHVENEGAWGFRGFGLLAAVVFALAGALLTFKYPQNVVGWLFSAVAFAFAVVTAAETYAVLPLLEGADGGVRYQVAWLTSWGWVVFLALLAFSILRFPTGDLPGPRWLGRERLMMAGFVFGCGAFALAPGPLNNMPSYLTNRYALAPGPVTDVFVNVGMLAFLASLVAAAVGAIQRYRSARGLQRQQMKLFAAGAAWLAVSMVLSLFVVLFVPRFTDVVEVLSIIGMLSIPVAMTVAILRYRLYDIDLIINRAVVYTSLSGVLVLVYLAVVVLLQQVLSPITAESDVAVAASTLAVAALFRPLRAHLQTFIDRRFFRSKYDASETLGAFSARLREHVDLESVAHEVIGVVGNTMQPAHLSLWLREQDGPR